MSWKVIVPIVCVVLAALLSWGAWNTLATANAVPRKEYQKHVDKADEKFDRIQKTLDDKVQKIYDHLLGEDE